MFEHGCAHNVTLGLEETEGKVRDNNEEESHEKEFKGLSNVTVRVRKMARQVRALAKRA